MSNFPTTQNYQPRYLVPSDTEERTVQTDDRAVAIEAVSQLRKDGEVTHLVDMYLIHEEGSPEWHSSRGYYGFPFDGELDDLMFWMDGKIARAEVDALDRLDDLCVQKELEHEEKIKARGGDALLRDMQALVTLTEPVGVVQ